MAERIQQPITLVVIVGVISALVSGTLVSSLVTKPAQVTADMLERIGTIEVDIGVIKAEITRLAARKIPPEEQLAFNQYIDRRMDRHEATTNQKFIELKNRLDAVIERFHRLIPSLERLLRHGRDYTLPHEILPENR